LTQRQNWESEIEEAVKREEWRLTGLTRPIKVFPAEKPLELDLRGYFTLAKHLLRRTPEQIERDLGLPRGYLKNGARLYKFTRLPQITEYEYELTANFPDGLVAALPLPKKTYFPPGSPKIKQWRMLEGKSVPVDPVYFVVRPGFTAPESWFTKP
jgi:hypothetical protein